MKIKTNKKLNFVKSQKKFIIKLNNFFVLIIIRNINMFKNIHKKRKIQIKNHFIHRIKNQKLFNILRKKIL